jgi:uncharacterized membrane protein YraQ (UPF0718 family)
MMIYVLYGIAIVALTASALANGRKTLQALRIAAVRFGKISPAILTMLVLFSIAITLLPQDLIQNLLGRQNGWLGVAIAALLGSATLMPGFIAFPLCGILLKQGVPYMVLAAFTTTLMTVGVLTYPLERQYFGRGVTIVRNAICLLIAIITAVVMGLAFGEILP